VDKVRDRCETARFRAASGGQPDAAQAAWPAAAHLEGHRTPAGGAVQLGVPPPWCDRDSTPRDHRVRNCRTPRADHQMDRSAGRTRRRAQQDPHSPPPGNRGQWRQGPQRASFTGRNAPAAVAEDNAEVDVAGAIKIRARCYGQIRTRRMPRAPEGLPHVASGTPSLSQEVARTACRITFVTVPGLEIMDRCGASTLVIWACAVLAMASCNASGMA
jgi:hypothetical protein